MSLLGVLLLGAMLAVIALFVVLLARQDRARLRRPGPDPEDGGDSFGDTSSWGGSGRPGS